MKVVVDEDALANLDGMTIDFAGTNLLNEGFEFRNPNVKETAVAASLSVWCVVVLTAQDVIDNFELLDDWEARYAYLVDCEACSSSVTSPA